MKVELQTKAVGTHRWEYRFRWYSWALPLHIGIGTSFFPVAGSSFDLDTWQVQRVLIVDVLFMRMMVVLWGPLFDDPEPDEVP